MRQKKKYIWVAWLPVIVMLTWWLCVGPKAATYYIKPTGSDGAGGTSWGTAWETTANLNDLTKFTGGDTVFFAPGFYVMDVTDVTGTTRHTLYAGMIIPPLGGTNADRTCYICGDGSTNNLNDPMITWLAARPGYDKRQYDSALYYVAKACTLSSALKFPVGYASWVSDGTGTYYTTDTLPEWPFHNTFGPREGNVAGQDTTMLNPCRFDTCNGASNNYQGCIPSIGGDPDSVSFRDSRLRCQATAGTAFHDLTRGRFYVHTTDNSHPNTHNMYLNRRATFDWARRTSPSNPAPISPDAGFVTIIGFDIRWSEEAGIHAAYAKNDSTYIDHCAITRVATSQAGNEGAYGMQHLMTRSDCGGALTCTYPYDRKGGRLRAVFGRYFKEPPDGSTTRSRLITTYSQSHLVVESCLAWQIGGANDWKNRGAGGWSYGNTLRYSTVYHGTTGYENLTGHNWDDSCYGNIFIGNTANNDNKAIWFEQDAPNQCARHHVYNNVIYQHWDGQAGGIYGDQDGTPNWFKYNIIYGARRTSHFQLTSNDTAWIIDSNLYYGGVTNQYYRNGTYMPLATWRTYASGNWASGYLHDVNSVTYDPGFTNASGWDFDRPSSTAEMNFTYGGRTWTRFGAWQPATSTPTSTSRRVKGVKGP